MTFCRKARDLGPCMPQPTLLTGFRRDRLALLVGACQKLGYPLPGRDQLVNRMPEGQGIRLDSWKAIAQYLGRDVRTAVRWEREKGLPVHRIGSLRGHSVFAFSGEIDQWLAGARIDPMVALPDVPPQTTDSERARSVRPRVQRSSSMKAGLVVAGLGIMLVLAVSLVDRADGPLNLTIEKQRVVARDSAGKIRWAYELGLEHDRPSEGAKMQDFADIDGDGVGEVLVLKPYWSSSTNVIFGSELHCLSRKGQLMWRRTFDDRLTLGNLMYGPPWIADRQGSVLAESGNWQVAVAVHHITNWPSILLQFDSKGQLIGRFVHSGWIDVVTWHRPAKNLLVLAGGTSNSRGSGMLAVLDGRNISGSSPEDPASPFHCSDCQPGAPLLYFTFPRSELNELSGSDFNRVRTIELFEDRINVHTSELRLGDQVAAAVYEFSPNFSLLRAYYFDRYWDAHRQFETQGKVRHSIEQCPERGGPRSIRAWDQKTGWRDLRPAQ